MGQRFRLLADRIASRKTFEAGSRPLSDFCFLRG
jgi:hypothetical protein